MASEVLTALTADGSHAVGSINSIQVQTLAGGARVKTAAVDNWTIVALDGTYDADDDIANCDQISAATDRGYLVATPEQRYMDEELNKFYNAVGEDVRPVVLVPDYTRFETSGYSLNTGVTDVAKGLVAHFDPTTKKYILSDSGTPHADYATAGHQFEVVGDLEDTAGNFSDPTVRLMCKK